MSDSDTLLSIVPLIVLLLVMLPVAKMILQRTGHSRWWVLLALVPIANLGGLWGLAVKPWPKVEQ